MSIQISIKTLEAAGYKVDKTPDGLNIIGKLDMEVVNQFQEILYPMTHLNNTDREEVIHRTLGHIEMIQFTNIIRDQ